MSQEFYRWIHILGLVCTVMGFGLLIAYFTVSATTNKAKSIRKAGFIAHGVGLALILVSGFGLLARLGIMNDLPVWVFVKLAAWILLGSAIALIKRKPEWNVLMIPIVIGIVISAAYFGVYKPGLMVPAALH